VVKNRITGLWSQTVTMNNISGLDLTGNLAQRQTKCAG